MYIISKGKGKILISKGISEIKNRAIGFLKKLDERRESLGKKYKKEKI